MHSAADLVARDLEFLRKFVHQTVGNGFLTLEREEGVDEVHVAIYDGINVIFDVFRIRGDDRAVIVVVCVSKFVPFIRNAGIENVFHTLVDQPLYMSVSQLGRVAFRFTGDGLNAQLIHLSGGSRREDHTEFQRMEKGEPERIVLVHIQDSRDTDDSADSLFFGKRFVIKVTL